jgi:hypothetical protein
MCERQDEVGVGWSVVDRATFDRRVNVSRLVKYRPGTYTGCGVEVEGWQYGTTTGW